MLRNRVLSCGFSLLLSAVVVGACSSSGSDRDEFGSDKDSGQPATTTPGIGDDGDAGLGLGSTNGGKTVELEGVTYAPNGTLKLAGVLVYWTATEPEAIPEGVYCDTCIELPKNTSAVSGSDGKFTLTVPVDRDVYVVSQKGQFRRVRKLSFAEDDTKFDKELTTLPGKTDASEGDTIPRIALMHENDTTTYDMIQTALEGLGIEDWDNLDDDHDKIRDNIGDYNIAMFPCSPAPGSKPEDQAEIDSLRSFVQAGGKMYVSDYSHAYADTVFPEYFSDKIDLFTPADEPSGTFEDEGLSNWLTAIGDDPSDATFQGVWSNFNGVQSAEVPAPDGSLQTFEPKVWARITESGDKYKSGEASVSFPYGCGRAMASIFHVHGGDSSNLLVQEKALLYMLLDISACVQPGGDVH